MKLGLKIITLYKAFTGVLALAFGAVMLFLGPVYLNRLVAGLVAAELQEDPTDFFINMIAPHISFISPSNFWLFFAGLMVFGITHLVIAYEVSKERYWPLVWVFWVLLLFLPFEVYSLFSLLKISKIIIFLINTGIVVYLFAYIKKFHKTFNVFKHLPYRAK